MITRLRLADDETMAIEWLHAPVSLLPGLTLTAGTALNFLKGTDATGVASFLVECSVEVGQELSV